MVDTEVGPPPDGFSVALPDESEKRKRIERAARAEGESVRDFLWNAVALHLDCAEEGMDLQES